MLFAEPLANSQKDVWVVMGLSIEQNFCFIIVPIVVYLPLQVNLFWKDWCSIYATPAKLVAEDGIAPPIWSL